MEIHEDWGTTEEGLRRLKDCDVVFCCVDKFARACRSTTSRTRT